MRLNSRQRDALLGAWGRAIRQIDLDHWLSVETDFRVVDQLVRKGLIIKARGHWKITDLGMRELRGL